MRRLLYVFLVFQTLGIYSVCISQEYFQQEVNSKIDVKLNDTRHELDGFISIEYKNNSPDTLMFLYFHLWPNAYKNRSTELAKRQVLGGSTDLYFAKPEELGYIDSLCFISRGKEVQWEYHQGHIDICKVLLNAPLLPDQKLEISTPFFVKIPGSDFSRLGHCGDSYQITQWYPKPAVYDKMGWHPMSFLDQGEFYSEYGSFDVSITLPDNYVVGATGNLENEEERSWLNSLDQRTRSINKFVESDTSFPQSSTELKTITFHEENIHDFAWFADKRYHVLKSEVVLPGSGDTVITWAMFTNLEGNLWKKSLDYVNDAVYYFSKRNGDYPYKQCTAVEGALSAGGGMEYPTITIIGFSGSAGFLEDVIFHEVGHNWFYSILGSNERAFPWMDEGINSYYELSYFSEKYPTDNIFTSFAPKSRLDMFGFGNLPLQTTYEITALLNSRRGLDQPVNLHSTQYSGMNYFSDVYMKTAFLFNYLEHYLGREEFDRIMKIYFETWKFKHPSPEDFALLFHENCTKNLSWFFDDLLTTTKVPDYKIKAVQKTRKKEDSLCHIYIKNKGMVSAPFTLTCVKNDRIVFEKWIEGFTGKKMVELNVPDFDHLVIDNNLLIPDQRKTNNSIRSNGVLKKVEPLKLHLFGSLESHKETDIYYAPAIGWNSLNSLMLGAAIYNSSLLQKRVSFQCMPMYSFGTNDIAGFSNIGFTTFSNSSMIRFLSINLSARRFAFAQSDPGEASFLSGNNYHRFMLSGKMALRNDPEKNNTVNTIELNGVAATNYYNPLNYIIYYNLMFDREAHTVIYPYHVHVQAQAGDGYIKSWLEASTVIPYNAPKKGLSVRLFAGKMLYESGDFQGNVNFRLSGWSANRDYSYDHFFMDRSNDPNAHPEHFASQQFVKTDGGFTTYTLTGQTNDWLVALNISTSIPGKIPIQFYTNVGTYQDAGSYSTSDLITYEAGVEFILIPDIFVVYFPFLWSSGLNEYSNDHTDNYFQKIRFTLNIYELNPFPVLRDYPYL